MVNPKRADCSYPDKHLAGVGVALKLVQALCQKAGREAWLPAFVKMAAIGTLADVVPLVGENRVIAKLGLELLTRGPHTRRAARAARRRRARRQDHRRLSHRVHGRARGSTPPAAWPRADLATRLLLANDEALAAEAQALAQQLDAENTRRREEEQDIVAAARKIVDTDPDVGAQPVLVVAGEGWHRGVIGIVASKLVDAYYRPAIVLSIEDGEAHGSCRSIPGFDILARARIVRADAAPLRRPQAGGGPAARRRRHRRRSGARSTPTRSTGSAPTTCGRSSTSTARWASTRSRRRSWST